MAKSATDYGLGRVCPRCKTFTVIFRGVDADALHLLPVTGKFVYPCKKCGWTMECDSRFLVASDAESKTKE
ncbi:MAG TPA: hypothetical protein PKM48_05355 [Parvularculaceae bacterium]|nr:hypothetical protein [Parvularculaceae bacterium]HNS85503.1 hypothetical protein [Parvularculaceae bacterium]